MNKDLPKVFVNPIDKELKNTQEYFYSKEVRSIPKMEDIPRKINEIFASPNHVYKSRVRIFTDHEFDSVIVGRANNYLLTLEGNKIRISDIKKIEKI